MSKQDSNFKGLWNLLIFLIPTYPDVKLSVNNFPHWFVGSKQLPNTYIIVSTNQFKMVLITIKISQMPDTKSQTHKP